MESRLTEGKEKKDSIGQMRRIVGHPSVGLGQPTTKATTTPYQSMRQRSNFDFAHSKEQCLFGSKRDKSFAGRIDPHAVDICAVINEREDCYTTSSCAGRCFLYRGPGIKSTNRFRRYRISHDIIRDPKRYFDLSTLQSDPSGGGDPIRTIGQYDHKRGAAAEDDNECDPRSTNTEENGQKEISNEDTVDAQVFPAGMGATSSVGEPEEAQRYDDDGDDDDEDKALWLRFEPFILHVACRSWKAASKLLAAARPAFKNVGVTSWRPDGSKCLVAIWGDEGLEMPLCMPNGTPIYQDISSRNGQSISEWLTQLVNERHERNWSKIDRFVENVRNMEPASNEEDDEEEYSTQMGLQFSSSDMPSFVTDNEPAKPRLIPRRYDVLGDVAYLHSMPEGDEDHARKVGEAIMKKNKSIKLVVVRQSNLNGTERAPGEQGMRIVAGIQRSPLMTSHIEYGIKCVIDLERTFFSPRMGPERMRICQQVARGEHVLVLFAGVGMEALQIAGRTEAASVVAVELNEHAITCAERAKRMLVRNKSLARPEAAAERLQIVQGDVLDVLSSSSSALPEPYYDRILAPRPKEGALDGDLGNGDGGMVFLNALLPRLKPEGGECHWYDFAADHEFPQCERTRNLLERCCNQNGLELTILHVANAGSVAKRQLRVCVDFKVMPKSEP